MNLVTVFLVLLSINQTPSEKIDIIANALLKQYNVNFDQCQYDFYKKDHNTEWRGNVEGYGVYSYKLHTIYFKEIVGTYNDIFADSISKNNFPDHFVFENISPTNDDYSYMIKVLGKPNENKSYINDEIYGNTSLCIYKSSKFIIKFILDKEKIKSIEIY